MNRYYVYNRTRKTWCEVISNELLVEGQVVFMRFENTDIEICECEVFEVIIGLESWYYVVIKTEVDYVWFIV